MTRLIEKQKIFEDMIEISMQIVHGNDNKKKSRYLTRSDWNWEAGRFKFSAS